MEKLYGNQPMLLQTLVRRPDVYNETLAFLRNPPKDCKLTVIAPDAAFKVKRLTMDKVKLALGYRNGVNAARRALGVLKRKAA